MGIKLSVPIVLGIWVVAWIALVALLIVYWHSLPMYVSWPLAVFEALLVPDVRTIKKHIFKIDHTRLQ